MKPHLHTGDPCTICGATYQGTFEIATTAVLKRKVMTLFEKVEELVGAGYEVNFSREPMNLVVKMKREQLDRKVAKRENWLPLADHFTESKIVGCLDFMKRNIDEELLRLDI